MIALEPEAASIYVRKLRLYQLVPDTSVTGTQTLGRNGGASAKANRYSYYAPEHTPAGNSLCCYRYIQFPATNNGTGIINLQLKSLTSFYVVLPYDNIDHTVVSDCALVNTAYFINYWTVIRRRRRRRRFHTDLGPLRDGSSPLGALSP